MERTSSEECTKFGWISQCPRETGVLRRNIPLDRLDVSLLVEQFNRDGRAVDGMHELYQLEHFHRCSGAIVNCALIEMWRSSPNTRPAVTLTPIELAAQSNPFPAKIFNSEIHKNESQITIESRKWPKFWISSKTENASVWNAIHFKNHLIIHRTIC